MTDVDQAVDAVVVDPNDRRARVRPTSLLAPFALFERGRGMTSLRCRVCGTTIGKMSPVGQQRVRRGVNQQTIVETDLQFMYLANYREVELFMENGDRHVGNSCADCAAVVQADPVKMAQFYETDLQQWRSEGHTITAKQAKVPLSVGRIADAIKD